MIEFIEAINEELLPRIAYLIPKLIVKIIGFVVKNLPKLVAGIIEGLIKAFFTVDWFDVIKQIFMGFIDAFKDLFGIHSPSTLFEGFGTNMVEGLIKGLKGIAEAVNAVLQPLYNLVIDVFGKISDFIDSSITASFDGLVKILNSMNSVVIELTDISFKGFAGIIESSGTALAKITDSTANLIEKLTDLIDKVNQATSVLGLGGGSSGSSSGGSGGSSGLGISLPGLSLPGLGGGSGGVSLPGIGDVVDIVKGAVDMAKEAASGEGYGKNSTGSTAGDLAVDLLVPFGFARHWFANGSQSVASGLALVGEAGPELVRFRGGEQVLNNRNTNKALSEMGGKTINQNITFNNLQDTTAFAMMQQLKQYNRQMAINGIL